MFDLHHPIHSSIKRNVILLPAVALLVSSIYSPTAKAKIEAPKLRDMIASSDCIVLGKVIAISKQDKAHIAEVEVERVLKGERTIKRLYFWATSTWACDISHAEQNESGLYFLRRVTPTLETDMQRRPLYCLTSSGYGHFINKGQGRFEAPDLVRFPRNMSVTYVSKGKYISAKLVTRDSILRFISTGNKRTRPTH